MTSESYVRMLLEHAGIFAAIVGLTFLIVYYRSRRIRHGAVEQARLSAVKWCAVVLGCIPVLGWLLGLAWNLWRQGNPFYVGEWGYLPLWFSTLPFYPLADWFGRQNTGPLAGMPNLWIVIYTLAAAIAYAIVGLLFGMLLRAVLRYGGKQEGDAT